MSDRLPRPVAIAVPIIVASSGLLSLLLIARALHNAAIPQWTVSRYNDVNLTFTMQIMVLSISFIVLGFMYVYDRVRFKLFFRWGVNRGNSWSTYGPFVAVSFTLGAIMMMSFSVTSQHGTMEGAFVELIPWVLLLAATNAWSEEIFARFVIVAGLHDTLSPVGACWISAVLFGAAHFQGTPSGPFGMIITGLLGWVLAKSVVDTKGIGWALIIHFLGDVVIFGSGAMVLASPGN
jgi:membrane protease YdiL (CAAX protease family)